jgi:hypothetical protein
MQLLPDQVRVGKLSAMAADTAWTGSLEMPRGCGTPGACQLHFSLSASQIGFTELSEWLNPIPKQRPWYRVLESGTQAAPSFLQSLRATGRVTADRLQVQSLGATHVSTNVEVDGGKLHFSELNADFLGGKHRGEWRADFSGKAAACSGTGNLTGVSLVRLADTMKDEWIVGTATGGYQIKGPCPAEFWTSAEGTLQFEVTEGNLPHVSLTEDAGPLRVTRFAGLARLHTGGIEIKDAKLDSPSGKFLLSGTASLKREIDFKLARSQSGSATYAITGTLAEPKVVPVVNPETQARLKTEPAK